MSFFKLFKFLNLILDFTADVTVNIRVSIRKIVGGELITKWEKAGIYEYDWVLADIQLESLENFQVNLPLI